MFGKGIWCHCLYSNKYNNCSSCGVSNCLKNISSYFHFYIICYYMVANINAIIWLRKFFMKYFFDIMKMPGSFEVVECRHGQTLELSKLLIFNRCRRLKGM